MARRRIEFVAARDLHRAAEIEQQHAVTDLPHHAEIMGDQEQRQIEFPLQPHQQIDDLGRN
jgi:hypothetical protein